MIRTALGFRLGSWGAVDFGMWLSQPLCLLLLEHGLPFAGLSIPQFLNLETIAPASACED